ncbi:MAG TPA: glycoside hydrolase family 31 protein [Verrucomicrobiae bacterium]
MQTIQRLLLPLFVGGLFTTLNAASAAKTAVHKDAAGVSLAVAGGTLKLRVFSPRVIEVVFAPGDISPTNKSLAVINPPQRTKWKLAETGNDIFLRTAELTVHVNRADGAVTFADAAGKTMLAEKVGGRSFAPTRVGNIDTLRSEQAFELTPDEAVYGLGQHQQGQMNYRGGHVHLQQRNTEVAVPMLVSSRGYGVLWDNPAVTDVNFVKTNQTMIWNSESADAIDYYFIYGPELDQVIAGYRNLTGAAPMFGKWAWGFWQCKERYKSQQELLDVAAHYRQLHIPFDGIIQDWQYWSPNPWGSHQFDTNRYPDPAGMMHDLHTNHVHALISVWAKFDVDSPNADELRKAGGFYPQVIPYAFPAGKGQWYDAFNPVARKIYWQQISRELFAAGLDGWWLDASEPELSGKWGEFRNFTTAAGPGAKVFNAYPLMHTAAIYEGQRAENSDKRVFTLTRSAYTGQQRNAAVTWSGDIRGSWPVFKKQIPAGLNFVASGIPYWNTDTGGFFGSNPDDPKYCELFTRWFQFSTFCPMFRVHGTDKPKEMWRFDDATQKILIQYDQLRYHLLPYIYSVSWMVTHDGYTMMRPLVMDFRHDAKVFDIADQYTFGPALMACPVTSAGATNRNVYLPAGADWFDFWTGLKLSGGQTVSAASPIQTLPLFVRAGSIIPYGPQIEYAMEKSDPLELRVYRGANGSFTLYEDEGDNYNYEKGAYTTISFTWNEAQQMLTIGQREGGFPGMLKEHTFRIVFVSPDHGAGVATEEKPDQIIRYTGKAVSVPARK